MLHIAQLGRRDILSVHVVQKPCPVAPDALRKNRRDLDHVDQPSNAPQWRKRNCEIEYFSWQIVQLILTMVDAGSIYWIPGCGTGGDNEGEKTRDTYRGWSQAAS